jgi:hypothetical protein
VLYIQHCNQSRQYQASEYINYLHIDYHSKPFLYVHLQGLMKYKVTLYAVCILNIDTAEHRSEPSADQGELKWDTVYIKKM